MIDCRLIAQFPISISSPVALLVALILAVIAVIGARRRRVDFPRASLLLSAIGLALLCLAAGAPWWNHATPQEVVVMVDLSPSTRGANFRNRALLETRVHELLGNAKYRIEVFANRPAEPMPSAAVLSDVPSERTIFRPAPGAPAVVLFSDAQFEMPAAAPPTYVVIDPGLESPPDAKVNSLEVRGQDIIAKVSNSGAGRTLIIGGGNEASNITVPAGEQSISSKFDPQATHVAAQFSPADLWPENDQLVGLPPPHQTQERWWVGTSDPGEGWRRIAPTQFPADSPALLAPSIIALENVAADELTDLQRQGLEQYVRDLGGAMLILGGDHAFAAGGYAGTVLDALSPLASEPPQPTMHWLLLLDGSGSMATADGGASRWQVATDAMVKLIAHLPPDDLLSVGSFAEDLNWWSTSRSVKETAAMTLPPQNVFPHGPTNLEAALKTIATQAQGDLPRQLLVLSDADAQIDDPAALALALKQKNIRLHVLAIGEGSGLPALQIIVGATGGTISRQFDPARWAQSAMQLLRAASPKLLQHESMTVRWLGDLPRQSVDVSLWNQTWLKQRAGAIAEAQKDHAPVGAQWNIGEGRVAALAFDASPAAIEPLVTKLARPPRDPRFMVTWDTSARLKLSVQAGNRQSYLNDRDVRLELTSENGQARLLKVPQTAPGEYELAIDAPRDPVFAAARVDGKVIERIAVAGRYAPEFGAIGNDHRAMLKLAKQSGGAVIAPVQHLPIDFRFPVREVLLASWLTLAGAICVGMALARWNWG
jgi:hypothetical protein